MYTNVDSLTNKLQELNTLIHTTSSKPNIKVNGMQYLVNSTFQDMRSTAITWTLITEVL